MSFPDNISKHRLAVMEMLGQAFQDPTKRTMLYTRGISMYPFLRARDQIVVSGRPVAEIQIGDVIAYKTGDLLVAHRVVATVVEGGVLRLYEKGDNNMYLTPIDAARVLGVVVEVVSGNRRLRLERWHQRWVGIGVAWYGKLAVRIYGLSRALGSRVIRRGSAISRLARRVLYFTLQSPSRVVLQIARWLP